MRMSKKQKDAILNLKTGIIDCDYKIKSITDIKQKEHWIQYRNDLIDLLTKKENTK
jgi:hypothetical protein